jgi:PAS domain S-box-containing protein
MSHQGLPASGGSYLTIGQAAEMLGVSAWTLRNWDRSGRLKPDRHPSNGYRIYRQEQIQLFKGHGADARAVDHRMNKEGEHVVQFYETDTFLVRVVADFLAPAITSREGALLIATPEHREGIEQELAVRGIDFVSAIGDGTYRALDAAATLRLFMVDGLPDAARFAQTVGTAVESLSRAGRCPRAFGEMVALLWTEGRRDAAIQLEQMWNELRDKHAFSLLCGYPIAGFAREGFGASFLEACGTHSHVMPAEGLLGTDDRYGGAPILQRKTAALEAEIAHRKGVEKALLQRERDFSDFLENAMEGLHRIGPDGTILWANAAEMKLLGYTSEEYIGRKIADFHVDPVDVARIQEALLQGEKVHNFPARMRCKDGSVRHVLIHANARIDQGRLLYTRAYMRDVTDQERARARLAAIVESSDDAIVSKTLEGVIVSWNKAAERLFGYSEQEAVGRPITMLIPPDRLHEEKMILSRLANGEHVDHFETIRIRKDGRPVEVSISVAPVRDSSGKVIGASKIARNMSERRQVEGELRQAKFAAERAAQAKDQFLAVLSHELRTPLTPVTLAIDAIKNDPATPVKFQGDLEMIQRNIGMETRLIDDLLDLSRVISGKMTLKKEEIALHALVRNAVEMVRSDTEEKRQTVQLCLDAPCDQVRGDSVRLHQVVWNLLKNAVKFTPGGGRIVVRTRHSDGPLLSLEVEDSGVGIDAAVLPNIFNPFDQGGTANRQFGGLGLGLAISQAIVGLHGGSIRAHSDGQGRGARFTIELPCSAHAKTPAPTEGIESEVASAGSSPVRLLLVDDHRDTLEMLKRLLSRSGHTVTTADSLAQAVHCLATGRFDILISDIGLPDGSGHEVMRLARQGNPEVRGIALTGFGMAHDIQRSEDAGFDVHLCKPIDYSQLTGAIRQLSPADPRASIEEGASRSLSVESQGTARRNYPVL